MFLLSGLISHNFKDIQDLRKLNFTYGTNPLLYVMLLIGVSALVGFPSIISNYSKELIFLIYGSYNLIIYLLLILSINLTIFYGLKLLIIFFSNNFKLNLINFNQKNTPFFTILYIPIFLLFFFFYIKFNYFFNDITLDSFIIYKFNYPLLVEFHHFYFNLVPLEIIILSFLIFTNFNNKIINFQKYNYRSLAKFSILNFYNDFLNNKIYYNFLFKINRTIPLKFNLFMYKLYKIKF